MAEAKEEEEEEELYAKRWPTFQVFHIDQQLL